MSRSGGECLQWKEAPGRSGAFAIASPVRTSAPDFFGFFFFFFFPRHGRRGAYRASHGNASHSRRASTAT